LTWARREKKKPIGSIGEIKLEREEHEKKKPM
jgi:hypothetical protein